MFCSGNRILFTILITTVISIGLFLTWIKPSSEFYQSPIQTIFNYPANYETKANIAEDSTVTNFDLMVMQTKICLLEQMKESPFTHEWIFKAVNVCCASYNRALNLTSLIGEEVKHVILPADQNSQQCTVVTLGVGNNIGAEEHLKSYWPLCKFYGADPIYQSGKIYEKVGKYFEIAVGAKDGNYTASVLTGGNYVKQTAQHINFQKFLKIAAIEETVDYLLIDAEGAEYELLPILESMHFRQKPPEGTVKICQFNVELHLPLTYYGMDNSKFNKLLKKFLLNTTFLPLTASPYGGHIRMAWIDFGEKSCVEKYLPTFSKDYVNFILKPFGFV